MYAVTMINIHIEPPNPDTFKYASLTSLSEDHFLGPVLMVFSRRSHFDYQTVALKTCIGKISVVGGFTYKNIIPLCHAKAILKACKKLTHYGYLTYAGNWRWVLTEQGMAKAKEIYHFEEGKNYTREWLNEHLKVSVEQTEPQLLKTLRLILRKEMKVSRRRNLIDDHINTFLCRIIRCDSLRNKILAKEKITYSLVALWATRSAYSETRHIGADPVGRTLYGAKTDIERNKPGYKESFVPKAGYKVVRNKLTGEVVDAFDTKSLPDSKTECKTQIQLLWAKIAEMLKTAKPNNYDLYLNAFEKHVLGYTEPEIASFFQIERKEAQSILLETRRLVKRSLRRRSLGDLEL